MHITIVNQSSDWTAATIGATAAIMGALVVMVGGLLTARANRRAREADEHVARLDEFAAVIQVYGTFVLQYPAKSPSRNPIEVAAHNLDVRLTQRQWLQQIFHVSELFWRAATAAISDSTEEELAAITDVMNLVGQFRIGEPLPDLWDQASSHITYLAREARSARRRRRFRRSKRKQTSNTAPEANQPNDSQGSDGSTPA